MNRVGSSPIIVTMLRSFDVQESNALGNIVSVQRGPNVNPLLGSILRVKNLGTDETIGLVDRQNMERG